MPHSQISALIILPRRTYITAVSIKWEEQRTPIWWMNESKWKTEWPGLNLSPTSPLEANPTQTLLPCKAESSCVASILTSLPRWRSRTTYCGRNPVSKAPTSHNCELLKTQYECSNKLYTYININIYTLFVDISRS